MSKTIRILLALLLLAISITLLVWGFWPGAVESRIVSIPPADLQLPTPEAFLWGVI